MELISVYTRLYKYVDRILVAAAISLYMHTVLISLMHPLPVGYVLYKKAESYMQEGRICTEPIIIRIQTDKQIHIADYITKYFISSYSTPIY